MLETPENVGGLGWMKEMQLKICEMSKQCNIVSKMNYTVAVDIAVGCLYGCRKSQLVQ